MVAFKQFMRSLHLDVTCDVPVEGKFTSSLLS